MSLTAGIVGLPNVGKSTLFNAITKQTILAANYPFATIDPNVGIVNVPDPRIEKLNEMYHPLRLVPTSYEFNDIAIMSIKVLDNNEVCNELKYHFKYILSFICPTRSCPLRLPA